MRSDAKVTLPNVVSSSGTLRRLTRENSHVTYEMGLPSRRSSSSEDDVTTVYCLPGIGDLRHSYRFIAPELVKAGYQVIVQDLRGVGDSGTDFEEYTIEAIASDVIAVLAYEGINERVVVMGNSLSAAVAVEVSAQLPNVVVGVITTGGFFRDMPNDYFFKVMTPLLFNHLWGQPVWASAFKSFFKSPPSDLQEYIKAMKAKMLSNCDHAGIIGAMIRASKNGAWSKIGSIQSKVLLIMGRQDPDFSKPEEEVDFVADALTSASSVQKLMVDDAGHYPHVEQPDVVISAVLEFLASY